MRIVLLISQTTLNEFVNEFGNLVLDDPIIIDDFIAVIPIIDENSDFENREYITAEEAGDALIIKDTGNINEVLITNKHSQTVLIVAGTIVKSSGQETQDRVIIETQLIEPHTTVKVPCRCVHASQPISTGSGFRYHERVPHRMMKMMLCSDHLEVSQMGVWNEIRGAVTELKSRNLLNNNYNSDRLTDVLENLKAKLSKKFENIESRKNQVGVIVVKGDKILGIELVDHPATYKSIHYKILKGYIDALIDKTKKSLNIDKALKEKLSEIRHSRENKVKNKVIKEGSKTKCEILFDKKKSNKRIMYRCI